MGRVPEKIGLGYTKSEGVG